MATAAYFYPGRSFPWISLVIFAGMVLPAWAGSVMSQKRPLIEISAEEICFRYDRGVRWKKIPLANVVAVEWPGGDNVALRLRSDEVVSIPLTGLPEAQWASAREAIVNAAEGLNRASGS